VSDEAYAELHAHTNFSFLDGTSSPEELVEAGAAMGLRALAITDHDSLSGVVRFAAAAKRRPLAAIVGVELTLQEAGDGAPKSHVVLLAKDVAGYRNICTLLTEAYERGGRDGPAVPFGVLAGHGAGLIVLSGCPRGELPRALRTAGLDAAREVAERYREAFGAENYFVEVGHHALQADGPRNAGLRAIAKAVGVGLVATNDVHYHARDRALLHDVVTCIRHRTTLAAAGAAGGILRGNDEYVVKGPEEMGHLFRVLRAQAADEGRAALDPLRNSVAIAERCTFGLKDLTYTFPKPDIPNGESEMSFLLHLVNRGKNLFYGNANAEVEARIAHELQIVEQLKLAGYLLIFKEIVDWSQHRGIVCSIRGSAPASALLYCLGLCPIDPLEHGLLFERFCSPERQEYPDIDLDFPHERREEVIQHVYTKYGRARAAMVCEVNTYRIKSALRDVAKVLGLSAQRAQQLADQVDWHDPDPRDRLFRDDAPAPAPAPAAASSAPGTGGARPEPGANDGRIGGHLATLLLDLSRQLHHSPRHHSIHVGGMVISEDPLTEVTSIEPARMPGRTILPWDKDDLTLLAEEFGINLIKIDLLGLGMLSLIERCFTYVREATGERLGLHGFRYDPRVFDVLGKADTIGLFQVESRAQQSFLPRLQPRTLSEVAISVGAIRPGPGAARAGEHIVRRRQGREPITYPAPELRTTLRETYGVLLWQEQCIEVAVTAAGYTPGEGDQLRRAMSHKRSYERMESLTAELVGRMVAHHYSQETAEAVRQMICGFAGYGFPRSHAYAFAHLALISATLRLRYPAAYYAALLNCQPMGFYAPHTLIWDAHRHDVAVLPVDVNRSAWECTLEPVTPPDTTPSSGGRRPTPAIRLGLKEVDGLGSAARVVLEREQAAGPFRSLADFVARTGFDREILERLAEVGAFISLPDDPQAERRATVWATGELAGFGPRHLPGLAPQVAEVAALDPMSEWDEVQADYRGVGFSLGRHVVTYFRSHLERLGARTAVALAQGKRGLVVRAGGLVIVRQRPETAGHLLFLTLEDETGLFNAVVYPQSYERLRRVLRGAPLIVVEGPLRVQDSVVHILVRRAWSLTQDASLPRVPSHDFH
jgi:error-prone DNA polymerase